MTFVNLANNQEVSYITLLFVLSSHMISVTKENTVLL